MQQKEVLLIVGVLVVGFFLLNRGTLSGRSIYDDYLTYPNQDDFNVGDVGSDAFDYTPQPATAAQGSDLCANPRNDPPLPIICPGVTPRRLKAGSQDGPCIYAANNECTCQPRQRECLNELQNMVDAERLRCRIECARQGCADVFAVEIEDPCSTTCLVGALTNPVPVGVRHDPDIGGGLYPGPVGPTHAPPDEPPPTELPAECPVQTRKGAANTECTCVRVPSEW